MLDFVSEVGARLEAMDRAQNEVALTWMDKARDRGLKPGKESTAETRLSQLLNRKPKGLKFFLDKPEATEGLLDALGYEGAERSAMTASAEAARDELKNPSVRLVLDVAGLTNDRDSNDRLFEWIESVMDGDRRRLPALLLVTRDQYRNMPRTLDDAIRAEDLRVEERAAGEARKVAAGLADGGALVISPADGLPETSSAPIRWGSAGLEMEPPDALEQYFSEAGLTAVGAPTHPLDALGVEAAEVEVPTDPLERRRLRRRLTDESEAVALKMKAADRAGLAAALGVVACSTPRERLEHGLVTLAGALGMEAVTADKAGLDAALARAARRPVEPRLFRIGDRLHAINVVAGPKKHKLLRRHDIAAPVPAITALQELVADWTHDQLSADPWLDGPVEQLIEGGAEPGAVQHARATMLWNDLVPGRREEPTDDPAGALAAMLRLDLPPTKLVLVSAEVQEERRDFSPLSYPAKDKVLHSVSRLRDQPAEWKASTRLGAPKPRFNPWLARDEEVVHVGTPGANPSREGVVPEMSSSWGDISWSWKTEHVSAWPGAAIPPAESEIDVDGWLDSVDSSPALGGADPYAAFEEAVKATGVYARLKRTSPWNIDLSNEAGAAISKHLGAARDRAKLYHPDAPLTSQLEEFAVATTLFDAADLIVARLLHGVRLALAAGRMTKVSGGRLLIQFGGFIEVEAWVRPHGASDAPLEVALDLVEPGDDSAQELIGRAPQPHLPGCSRLNAYRDPTRVHLRGAGFAATLRIGRSAFIWGAPPARDAT